MEVTGEVTEVPHRGPAMAAAGVPPTVGGAGNDSRLVCPFVVFVLTSYVCVVEANVVFAGGPLHSLHIHVTQPSVAPSLSPLPTSIFCIPACDISTSQPSAIC